MITTLLALATLFSVQTSGTVQSDQEAVDAIREVLDMKLVDYPSARLREVRVVTRPSNSYVQVAACGRVNSRTRSGGYGGWKRFVITNQSLQLEGEALFDRAWRVWCDGEDVVVVSPDVTDRVAPAGS